MGLLFLVVLSCNIPYLFFSGKEALLIIIDETMRRSISLVLAKKALQKTDQVEIKTSINFDDLNKVLDNTQSQSI